MIMKRHLRFKLFSPGGLRILLISFAAFSLVFSLILVGSYMNHSLTVANDLVVQRTISLADTLQAKLKALFLSASTLYQDQGVFNWINASQITSELDIAMVQATGKFMQSNLEVKGMVLYNKKEQRIYEIRRSDKRLYRNINQFAEEDVKLMIQDPQVQQLRYQLISYRGEDALAFLLPHSAYKAEECSALVLIYSPDAIANNVSNVLISDPLDGSTTFVTTADGRVVMGNAHSQQLDAAKLLSHDADASALWHSLLTTGYLAHRHDLTLQDWTVYSVLYVDSFLMSHMPFVKIMLVSIMLLAVILVIFFITYAYLIHQPYSRLAVDLISKLPNEAQETISPEETRQDVLTELRGSINYLLRQVTAIEENAHHQLKHSQFNAWVNTLGNERQMDVDQSAFFPEAHVQMGVVRIVGYKAQRLDYFTQRSLRQEVGNLLRSELTNRWPHAWCVDMGDGTFVLFINAPALVPDALLQELSTAVERLDGMLHVAVCCAVSHVMAPSEPAMPSVYRQLYKASFLGMTNASKAVYTLSDYERYCRSASEEDNQQITQAIIDAIRNGETGEADTAIVKFTMSLANLPLSAQQSSIYSLYMALFYHFSRYLTLADYETCQNYLADSHDLSVLESNLKGLCRSIRQEILPSEAASAQWHSIILDISEYIQNNIADPQLSVDMIAQKEGYSANYIRSMFKTYVGVSISDYIREKRIETACRLLVTSSAPITQVMECSGFSNKSSFFTQFKAQTGFTPNEYRIHHSEEDQ